MGQDYKVLWDEDDGEYLTVEFVRDNGERVVGGYKRIGWSQPPQAAFEDLPQRMSRGVSTSYRRRKKEAL
jgi:hypothetical protein